MTSRTLLRDEEGAAASALLIAAVLIGFAIFVYMAIPLGTAVDAKARNRTAADAAALAGAEGVREDLLAGLGDAGLPSSWHDLPGVAGMGRSAAEEYARYNDATLLSYYFDPYDGTAHVEVEGQDVDGQLSHSSAVAQVDLPHCDALDPPDPPTPTATPDPEPDPDDKDKGPADPLPSEPPPPPPPVDLSVHCDGFDLTFQVRYTEDGGIEVHFPPGQLGKIRDAMDVRLIA
ncbi:MAG: hypothetical protein ACTHKG_01340 [Nocardioides sp.]